AAFTIHPLSELELFLRGVGVCLADCETCDLESLAAEVADVLIREAVKPTDPRLARHLPNVLSYQVKASWQRAVLDCPAEMQHRWAELQQFHGILESDFKSCRAAGDRYFWTAWSYITDAATTPTGYLNFECQLIESPLGHGPLIYRGLMCKDVEGRFDDVFVTGYCLPTSCNGPPLEHFFGPVRQLSVLEFTPDLQPWWARPYESQFADLTEPRLVVGTCLAAGMAFRMLRWLLQGISALLSPSTSTAGVETDPNPVIPRNRLLVPDLLRIVAVVATLQCHTDFSNKWLKTLMSWLQFGIFFALSEFLAAKKGRNSWSSALVQCSRLWRKGSRELPHLALTVWAWSGAFLAGDWTGYLFQRVPGFTSAFYLGAQNCMRSLHQRGFLAELFHLPIYFVGAEAAHWKPCGSWLVRMDFQLEVALTSLQLVESLLGFAPRLLAEVFMAFATMAHMTYMTAIETEALGLVRGSFTFAWIMRRSLSLHAKMFRLSSPRHALGLATAFVAVAIAACTTFVSLPHAVRKAYPHLPEEELKSQLLIEEAKFGLLGTLALPHAALLVLHSSEFIEARCSFLKPLGPLCAFLGPLCFGVLLNHGFLAFATWEFIGKLPEKTLELPAVLKAPGRSRIASFLIYVVACYVASERLRSCGIPDHKETPRVEPLAFHFVGLTEGFFLVLLYQASTRPAALMVVVDIDYREYFLPDTIQELQRAFDKFDTSGDGAISVKELYQMFRSLGKKVSRQQLKHVLAEIDTDGNGEIEFEELCMLEIKMSGARPRADLIDYREFLTERQVAKLETAFLRNDRKNTGLIGLDAFCSIVESLAPWTDRTPVEQRATREDYEDVLAEVDPQCRGSIDFHQLCSGFAVLTKARKMVNYREYLQQDEVKEYRRIFNATTQKKGQSGLSKSDLDRILRRMGATLPKAQLREFFQYFDTDGSGLMDFEEFCVMLLRVRNLNKNRIVSPETCSCSQLWKEEEFSIEELQQSGFTLEDFKHASIPVSALHKDGGYSALELRRAGFSAKELKQGGVALMELRRGGYSLMDLRLAGFSAQALEGANRQLLGSFSAGDLSVLPRMAPKPVVSKGFALSSAGFALLKNAPGSFLDVAVQRPLQRQMTPMIREHTDWKSPYTGQANPTGDSLDALASTSFQRSRPSDNNGFLLDAKGKFLGG
ncbi:CML12, partial [Symbiodinium sp. CCMP2456]